MIASDISCVFDPPYLGSAAKFAPACRVALSVQTESDPNFFVSALPSLIGGLVAVLVAIGTFSATRRHALRDSRRVAFAELLTSLTNARGLLAKEGDEIVFATVDCVGRANAWSLLLGKNDEKLGDACLVISRAICRALLHAHNTRIKGRFTSQEQQWAEAMLARNEAFRVHSEGAPLLQKLTELGATWHRPVGRRTRSKAAKELVETASRITI